MKIEYDAIHKALFTQVDELRAEIEQMQPYVENYYRLLAEDEGTWADHAFKLAEVVRQAVQTEPWKSWRYAVEALAAYDKARHIDGRES